MGKQGGGKGGTVRVRPVGVFPGKHLPKADRSFLQTPPAELLMLDGNLQPGETAGQVC